MKIYARQVAPEYQESPLIIDGIFPDDIIITGNPNYQSNKTQEYDTIFRYFDDLREEFECSHVYYTNENGHNIKHYRKNPEKTLEQILRDCGFERSDGKPWTSKQKHEWNLLLGNDEPADDDEIILPALRLLTGHEWEGGMICGNSPSEWQDIIYRVDAWNREDISRLEAEYFNTGTEWIIDNGDFSPGEDTPDVISGWSIYCTSWPWDEESIRKEIACEAGVCPEDVVLYAFDGYTKTEKYRVA